MSKKPEDIVGLTYPTAVGETLPSNETEPQHETTSSCLNRDRTVTINLADTDDLNVRPDNVMQVTCV